MIFSHRDKDRAYNFIFNKFFAKFSTLKANKLNHAGQLKYIKSVLSSIPIYYMSTVLFSKAFIEKINSITRRFWWAGVQEENQTNPIAYRSWDDICKPIEHGGLGTKDMELVNQSRIIHCAWNIATNKNPLLSAILKAKYHPSASFWNAPNSGPRSMFWSSVLQVRHHLNSNAIYQIHNGNSSIWSQPWCPIWNNVHEHLILPIVNSPLLAKVSDLWVPETQNWNHQLLSTTFNDQAVQAIETTPIVASNCNDILRWTPVKDGLCTTKSAYAYLSHQQVHHLLSQGAQSLTDDANKISHKVWKSKSIPPILKTFAWRLIRRALATGERAGRYSVHIDVDGS
jgi:hypothetical protein